MYQKTSGKARKEGVGLALSGGGFRAALFHLGGLWRINELGWLKSLSEVTSVSGGSITAGYLGLRWKHLTFNSDNIATNFIQEIVQPLRSFCSRTIDVGSIIAGWISPFHNPNDLLAFCYRKWLVGDATLQNLPSDQEGPRFTIYATNLQTGVSVRLSHPYMADYRLGEIRHPKIQLATAIAASCAFPPILCPARLKLNPSAWEQFEGADLFGNKSLRSTMLLADGGVYDNLGLERIWDYYSTVLVSDAGAPPQVENSAFWLQLSQTFRLKRSIDIIQNQVRALRKRKLIEDFKNSVRAGTYWGIGTDIAGYKPNKEGYTGPLITDTAITGSLSRIRTRLNRFSIKEQEQLINWGYALADAAMRCYVIKTPVEQGHLPFPDQPLK